MSTDANEPTPEQSLELDVIGMVTRQKELESQEAELMQDPRFGQFLQAQREFVERSSLFWETVLNEMVANNIKSIKGDWGSITLTERMSFDIDAESLPKKFMKKEPDTKKIRTHYDLHGEAPKGATPRVTKYLTKKIK